MNDRAASSTSDLEPPSRNLLRRLAHLTGPNSTSALWRYSFAVALTALALAVRLILDPVFAEQFLYVTFYFAVLLIGAHAGTGPAMLCLAASIFLVNYFFVSPRREFSWGESTFQIGTLLYALV